MLRYETLTRKKLTRAFQTSTGLPNEIISGKVGRIILKLPSFSNIGREGIKIEVEDLELKLMTPPLGR